MLITVKQGYEYNNSNYATKTGIDLWSTTKKLSSSDNSHQNVKNNWIYYYSDQTGKEFYMAEAGSTTDLPSAPAGYYFETMENSAAIGAWISKYKQ